MHREAESPAEELNPAGTNCRVIVSPFVTMAIAAAWSSDWANPQAVRSPVPARP
jgi:hypothetical protein